MIFFPRAQHMRIYNLMTGYYCEFREVCEKQVIQTILVSLEQWQTTFYHTYMEQTKLNQKALDCAQEAGKNTRISADVFHNTSCAFCSDPLVLKKLLHM